jgi:hypothetical protein
LFVDLKLQKHAFFDVFRMNQSQIVSFGKLNEIFNIFSQKKASSHVKKSFLGM